MEGIEQKTKPDILKWILIALIVLGGLSLVIGGILVYQKAIKNKELVIESEAKPTLVPEETVEQISTPTPTPTIILERSDLKIEVLNGSGVPGTAAKAADFLEELGYQKPATGNADSYDYSSTIIKIKESKQDYLPILKEDLSEKYTLSEEVDTLDEDEDFDVVIIIGKE